MPTRLRLLGAGVHHDWQVLESASTTQDTLTKRGNILPTALITGVTGQDGSYLAEYLLAKGYNVFGLIRGQNNPKRERLEELMPSLELVEGDLLDQSSLIAALEYTQPDEVYNLAAISFVALSWKQALLTAK